jgi:hypothetical protein
MLGALIALCAAIAFGTGSVLQKVGAPPADAVGIRRLARHVVTTPTYLFGTSLDVFGFVLTALAARQLALFAVEGILSTGVGFTAVLAAIVLKEHLRVPAKLAVMAMIVGLALLSVSAAPDSGATLGIPLVLVGLSAVALLVVTLSFDRIVRSRTSSSALAVIAGVSFGAWASIPRLTHDGAAANAVGSLFVVIGITSYAAALRRGTAVSMMAITVAAESILPALCGLAVGDTARPGTEAFAVAGFVLAVASAVLIAVVDREEPEPADAAVPVGSSHVESLASVG